MNLKQSLAAVGLLAACFAPMASYAADPATPLVKATDTERNHLQSCLNSATGSNGAASATGGNLTLYKTCVTNGGYSFNNGNTDWWVARVNEHCAKDGTIVFGIGNDYNAYKACLSDRGVEPSLFTVSSKYIGKVNEHCWGEDPVLERVLSVLTIWGIEAALPSQVSKLQDFANFTGEAIKFAETGFDVQAYFDYLNQSSLPEIMDDMLPPNIYDVPPRALSNYASYKQCLTDRNIKGLDFKPMHTEDNKQLQVWSGMVNTYCYSQVVQNMGNVGWKATTYKQCLRDRAYPENGLTQPGYFNDIRSIENTVQWRGHINCDYKYRMSTDPKGYLACLSNIGVTLHPDFVDDIESALKTQCNNTYPSAQRGANAAQYRACLATGNVKLTAAEEATLNGQIKTHCDGSYYTGGRFSDYNAYFKCFTERGTTFVNDTTWQNGVKAHCSGSNMVVNLLNGYKTCLSQRQVPYDASHWQGEVKKHCDGSYYTGGRFADYNAYFKCFSDRGTSFVNDSTWQTGVRNHCGPSNVQYNKLPGYKTCLSQRQVPYLQSAWCPVVKTYCDAQWYPFGGKDRCFSERGCTIY